MSEFKLSCPHCQQHVLANDDWAGQAINCPHCQKPFTIPAPLGASPALSVTPQPLAPPQAPSVLPVSPPGPASSRTSALAIASLVLSLFGCVGITAIAAVICGHLARRKMRANPQLGGRGLALAGLIIGYCFLAGLILFAVVFGAAFLRGFEKGFNDAKTRSVAASGQRKLPLPDGAVSGNINGSPFKYSRATVDSFMGSIEINQGSELIPEQGVTIFLFPQPGEKLENRNWNFTPKSTGSQPHVHLSWKKDGKTSATSFTSGYEMELTTSAATNGVITGALTLKIAGETPASLKGVFTAPAQ